ncbi:MAG: hypothetical protein ACREON_00550 [Gemmatimonadaceae bacterium]
MTAHWILTILLAFLTVLNAIALIALIRQVGLLHLRLRPISALQDEDGPSPGMRLQFETKPWELGGITSEAERILIGFFSPTCGICGPLMPAFQSIADHAESKEAVVLATDADHDRASEYLREKRVELSFVAEKDVLKRNLIEGAPFAAVVDRDGIILAAGGVNTLEHVEWLLDQARRPVAVTTERAETRFASGNGRTEAVDEIDVVGPPPRRRESL